MKQMFFCDSCFLCDSVDVGNLISGSSAFSKSSLNIWIFSVQVLLKPILENFELAWIQLYGSLNSLWHRRLWDCSENWPFPVLWPLLSFQISWHIECSTFTTSSFRIWNSPAGIPSPHCLCSQWCFTSHSKMSGSRWASWLSGSWRSFLYSSVYSCHLFLISSVSVSSILFLPFIELIFVWNVALVSQIFLTRSQPRFSAISWASLEAQMVKNLPAVRETWVQSLGWEAPLEGGHGNPLQYSCLESPGGQRSLTGYSLGSQESDTTEQLNHLMMHVLTKIGELWSLQLPPVLPLSLHT